MIQTFFGLLWRALKWTFQALFGGVSAAAGSVIWSIYGLIAFPLHLALFASIVGASVAFVPSVTLGAYRWVVWVLELLPFYTSVAHWVGDGNSKLHAGATLLLGADAIARAELLVLLPWTIPGWVLLLLMYGVAGKIVNLPRTISARWEKLRQQRLENEVADLREEVNKLRPREGEILPPEHQVAPPPSSNKLGRGESRPRLGHK
ncbi:hypothetical protein FJY93_04465 [Candidatus Kaiserbacteria bacterium]|nr:hypothetical protein [Candidatus Kaiserbacteria bacterium]